jgi:peptide/nickel transport system permease protein
MSIIENTEMISGEGRNSKKDQLKYVSHRQLIWIKFKKHRLALISGILILFMYLLILIPEFISPYNPNQRNIVYQFSFPQKIHFIDDNKFNLRPFVYGYTREINPNTFQPNFEVDKSKKYPIYFLVHGSKYKLWNLIETDLHLFGVRGGEIFLFGTDQFGRDLFSRVIIASRTSMSIGLIGVFLGFILGLVLGSISGYYGGMIDVMTQRLMEVIRSFPYIPLVMALSAALPQDWSSLKIYFFITLILSSVGWTDLGRQVRSKILSLKNEDFITAARLSGTSELVIITRHVLPSFMSHIIASISLGFPLMILGETSLSFLGIGLRPPIISWGVLLNEAQNVHTLSQASWLLIPAIFVMVYVLTFNFLGDGLRNAADPYAA